MMSLDDDKQRMRTYKCLMEHFVRQRHAAKGGFGPVQHVAVSQLTHFVLGGIINSPGSTDAASVQQMLYDMDADAQTVGDTDHDSAMFWIDRGYRTPSVSKVFQDGGCNEFGTIQRQKTVESFPYTFDHDEVAHNVPNEGPPVSLYSRKGSNVALASRCQILLTTYTAHSIRTALPPSTFTIPSSLHYPYVMQVLSRKSSTIEEHETYVGHP